MARDSRRSLSVSIVIALISVTIPARADVSVTDFSPNLNLLGAAVIGDRLQLNVPAAFQNGTAVFAGKQAMQAGFEIQFRFQISGPGGIPDASGDIGGDGFALIIQNRGPTETGMFVHYIPYSIPNAIAIEFDTWHNSNVNDPNGNHISVQPVGPSPNGFSEFLHSNSLSSTTAIPNLSDGNPHDVLIRYSPGSLQVFVDDLQTPALTAAIDLTNVNGINRLDANGMAWISLAGGGGGGWENHDVLNWSFTSNIAPDTGFSITDFSPGLNLLSAATVTGDRLRLTPASPTQTGTAVLASKQQIQTGFETRFRFQISGPGGILDASGQNGGDGFAFIIQNQSPTSTGLFGPAPFWHIPYSIPNAFAVEFDTWQNASVNDPNGNHISLQPAGPSPDQFTEHLHATSLGFTTTIPNLSDGNAHDVRLTYEPGLLQVFVDDLETPVLSAAIDLTNVNGINRLDANGMAWVSLGAGTGGAFENHDILSWSFASRVPPTANAGADQSIHAGQLVTLDGSGSFDDNTATEDLLFNWTLISKPVGSTASLSGADTARPSFVADLGGDYVARLTVTDADSLASAPDSVVVSSLNAAPSADAGPDQGTFIGNAVTLDGSASLDPDLDELSLLWTLAGPEGSEAVLTGEATAFPTFTPDVAGSYTATLRVSDPFGALSTDSMVVAVIATDQFAQERVLIALNLVGKLSPTEVTSQGNQKGLQNLLGQVLTALQADDVFEARSKLAQAIERTDGCVVHGSPDGQGPERDWVTSCAIQATLFQLLIEALDALTP
jgi:Legume lectin domain/Bacterial lectin/PKD domain